MWLKNIVEAINLLHSNVWSLCLVAAGAFLTFKGHPEGAALTGAGLFGFKTSSDKAPEGTPHVEPAAKL